MYTQYVKHLTTAILYFLCLFFYLIVEIRQLNQNPKVPYLDKGSSEVRTIHFALIQLNIKLLFIKHTS